MKSSVETLEGNKVKLSVESTRPSSTATSTRRSRRSPARSASPASAPARRPAASSRPASALAPGPRAGAPRRHPAVPRPGRPRARRRHHRHPRGRDHRRRRRRARSRSTPPCEVRPDDHGRPATPACASSCRRSDVDRRRGRRGRSPAELRAPRRAGRRRAARRRAATTSPSTSPPPATASRSPASTPRTGRTRSARAGSPTTSTTSSIGASAGDELTFTTTPKGTEEPADFAVTVTTRPGAGAPRAHRRVGRRATSASSRPSRRGTANIRERSRRTSSSTRPARSSSARSPRRSPTLVDDRAARRARRTATCATASEDIVRAVPGPGHRHRAVPRRHRPGRQAPSSRACAASPANAVKIDLALRAVADAEELDVDDDDLDAEYERIALQVDQKPNQVRKAYEQQRPGARAARPRSARRKALDWLLHHVEFVDETGEPIDRDLVLGHGHDADGNHLPADDPTTTRPRRRHDHDRRRRPDRRRRQHRYPDDRRERGHRSMNLDADELPRPHRGRADQPGRAGLRPLQPRCSRRTSSSCGTPIDDTIANLICAQLLHLESENPDKDINIYINSPGGDITALFAIYDTMQFIKQRHRHDLLRPGGVGGGGAAGRRHQGQAPRPAARPDPAAPALRPGRLRPGHRHRARRQGDPADARPARASILAEHTGQPLERIHNDTDRDFVMEAEEAHGVRHHRRGDRVPGARRPTGAIR